MQDSRILKAILLVSGLLAAAVGAAILIMPTVFYSLHGIAFVGDASMLSEIRASGGFVLASGILILAGAVLAELAFTATLVSIFLYLSYGLSRGLSILIDGLPSAGLVQAAALETLVGLVCLFALMKWRAGRVEGL